MRTILFDNPKNALIFGGAILLGAVVLIGEEDDEGALVAAASSGDYDSTAQFSRADAGYRERVYSGSKEESDTGSGWASEGDLVDDASGDDASPTDSTPAAGNADAGTPASQREQPPGIDGPGT